MTIEEIIEALAQDFANNPQEDHPSRVSTIDQHTLLETMSALAGQPHQDGLSRVTFAEISELQPIADLIKSTLLDRPDATDEDEEFLRAELLREQLKFVALAVKVICDHYHHGPIPAHVSTKLMRSQLDDVAAALLRDLAIYGAFALRNQNANSKLHTNHPASR